MAAATLERQVWEGDLEVGDAVGGTDWTNGGFESCCPVRAERGGSVRLKVYNWDEPGGYVDDMIVYLRKSDELGAGAERV